MPEIVFNGGMWPQGAMYGCRVEKNGLSADAGGLFISKSTDALEASAVWNNFKIFASGNYTVSYYASDSITAYINDEPVNIDDIISMGNYAKTASALNGIWSRINGSPENAPFINAVGRYFWFMLEFESDAYIKSFKLYFNITPLTEYLPEFFHDDDFLLRLLSMLRCIYTEVDNNISDVSCALNYNAAQPEVLTRLAEWAGIQEPSLWPTERLRALIKNAHRLSCIKGTTKCIADVIELYTGFKPIIIEAYQAMQYGKEPVYGDDIYTVTALLNSTQMSEAVDLERLAKAVTYYKPMFVRLRIVKLVPTFALSQHTYLGINTELTVSGPFVLGRGREL